MWDTPTSAPQPFRGNVPSRLSEMSRLSRGHSAQCTITHKSGRDVPDVPGFAPKPFPGHFRGILTQARKRHINTNFFVRLVPVFTGFVPGTSPVCPWDKSGEKQGQKPRNSPYSTQWKPDFTGFVPGTNPVCPTDNPGTKGGTESLCEKSLCAFFARY